jgi:hypothetical protein
MQKIGCLIFSIIIFSSICSCQGIKVSPGKTILEMNTNEPNCTTLWVLPDKNIEITSVWSVDGAGMREKYNLYAKDVGIRINYTRLEYGKYEFCFSGNKRGYFYGIMFFKQNDSLLKFGTWIELNVESENIFKEISLITGNAIKSQNSLPIGLGIIFVLVLIIFILIIRNMIRTSVSVKHKHAQIYDSA